MNTPIMGLVYVLAVIGFLAAFGRYTTRTAERIKKSKGAL